MTYSISPSRAVPTSHPTTACPSPAVRTFRAVQTALVSRALALTGAIVLGAISLSAQGNKPCGTGVWPGVIPCNWTLTGSPYCVHGDINLHCVTIQAGVEVIVHGNYRINATAVTGLTAVGTKALPIIFRPAASVASWKGLTLSGDNCTLEYCHISGANDSGLFIDNCMPKSIKNCLIHKNTRAGHGGGLRIVTTTVPGTITVEDCWIVDNGAKPGHGGGVYTNTAPGKAVLRGCKILRNWANPSNLTGSWVGGGIYGVGDGRVENCRILDNGCYGYCTSYKCLGLGRGGGMFLNGGTWDVTNCVISRNFLQGRENDRSSIRGHAQAYGGGLYFYSGTLNLHNCIFGQNRCHAVFSTHSSSSREAQGAGLYVNAGTVDVLHCTFGRNTLTGTSGVSRAGSAIQVRAGTVSVTNSILYRNTGAPQISGTMTVTYSDVEGSATGAGNIATAPSFAGPGGDCSDLAITLGSPCIDTGDPASPADACLPPAYGTARPDMGAYGGALSCAWMAVNPFSLNIIPSRTTGSETVTFESLGGVRGKPVALIITGINTTPIQPIIIPGIAGLVCPAGDWYVDIALPAIPTNLTSLEWQSVSLSTNNNLLLSPIVSMKTQ